jgi:uncharacterized DUF497 family protein
LAGDIRFDWDGENRRHLAAHKVTPAEFEQVLYNNPLDRDYQLTGGEERYRSVGITNRGRLLAVIWTIRHGKVRPVTAFPAPGADRQAWREAQ